MGDGKLPQGKKEEGESETGEGCDAKEGLN